MYCYKCGKEIDQHSHYCPHCGAMVSADEALLKAVYKGDQKAMIKLYQILYNQIYNRYLTEGLTLKQASKLVNKAFKELLSNIQMVHSLSQFQILLDGIITNIAYAELQKNPGEHTIEESCYVPVDDHMIRTMLEEIKEKKKHAFSRKTVVLSGLVIAVIIATAGGYWYYQKSRDGLTVSQKKSYAKVTHQYVSALQDYSQNYYAKKTNLKKTYPLVYKEAQVTFHHLGSIDLAKKTLFTEYEDINKDGVKELLIGYKKSKNTFLTGIYTSHDNKPINMKLIKSPNSYHDAIMTSKHEILRGEVKNGTTVYTVLKPQAQRLKQTTQTTKNAAKYLKDHHQNRLTLSGETIQVKTAQTAALPDYQQEWLDAYKAKRFDKCNQIAVHLKKTAEEPCAYHMSQDMKKAYKERVKSYLQKYDGVTEIMRDNGVSQPLYIGGYFLTDLDNDGNAELLILWGNGSMADQNIDAFKYEKDGIRKIAEQFQIAPGSLYAYPHHAGVIENYSRRETQNLAIIKLSDGHLKRLYYEDNYNINDTFPAMGLYLPDHVLEYADSINGGTPTLSFDILE